MLSATAATAASAVLRRAVARRARSQSGIGLLEILLGLVIATMLIVPLVAAFIAMTRSGANVNETMNRTHEAQRIGEAWTHDVQSVAPDGVNEPDGQTCGEAASDEVELVTFAWDRASTASTTEKSVTWVARGFDENVSLVRRYCEGGNLQNGDGQVLAEDFGVAGRPISQLVNGGDGAAPGEFCPQDADGVKRVCTISIDADFAYELTVKRRVPDLRDASEIQRTPAPLPVSNILAHARWQKVLVDWLPADPVPNQPPVTTYRVYLYDDAAGTSQVGNPVDVDADGVLRAEFDGLDNDTPYFVRIRSGNSVGLGDYSGVYGPVTPGAATPNPPTEVLATSNPNAGTVDVEWTPSPTPSGAPPRVGFAIWAFVETTPDVADDVPLGALIGPIEVGDVTSATFDLPLEDFTNHRFVVSERNALGLSWDPAEAALGSVPNGPAVSNIAMPYRYTVFLSPSGNDVNPCTAAAPCRTLNRGFTTVAAQSGWPSATLALAGGTYSRMSLLESSLQRPTTVLGGFAPAFDAPPAAPNVSTILGGPNGSGDNNRSDWSALYVRGPVHQLTLRNLALDGMGAGSGAGASMSTTGLDVFQAGAGVVLDAVAVDGGRGAEPTGVRARSSSSMLIAGSTINSGEAVGSLPSGAGESAYGMRVFGGSNVEAVNSTIIAAEGVAGQDGANGATVPLAACPGSGGSSGGNGGAGGVGCSSARHGGNGGSGSNSGNGGGGSAGSGGAGGGGGSGCTSWWLGCNGGDGGQGNHGSGGGSGSAGSQTNADAGSTSQVWEGGNGTAGSDGTAGAGGGGGGGGGRGQLVFTGCCERGGGGGGGGGGGAAGRGGSAGTAGGASIGVLTRGGGTAVTLTATVVVTASGGNGGSGGDGSSGASGGAGGAGASGERGLTNGGGSGGAGGAGGGGGGGGAGAGGQGGPSFGVLSLPGTSVVNGGGTTVGVGAGGAAGANGTPGSGGNGGVSAVNGAQGAAPSSTPAAGQSCELWAGGSCQGF